ncbi:MAG: hypothetical protein K6E10_08480 [Eubacterium sp.]|nr:hypothetical protein [Eubacterium sp.]
MRTPRLGSFNLKDVEIYIAADTLSMMFGHTKCMNTIALDKARINYNQVAARDKGNYVMNKLNKFDQELDRVVGDESMEWGAYHCELHIDRNQYGPYVLADAGFFKVRVYTDDRGDYIIQYIEE